MSELLPGTTDLVVDSSGEELGFASDAYQGRSSTEALEQKVGLGFSQPQANTVLRGTGFGQSEWGKVDLSTDIVNELAIANGGAGTRYLQMVCFNFTASVSTGDGKFYLHIPTDLNGMNLTYVHARVITAGTTNTTDIQIANVTDTVDMLSTKLTIDSGETGSETAATAAVIDATKDDVATNDVLRVDVDAISTTAPKGLIITLGFALP